MWLGASSHGELKLDMNIIRKTNILHDGATKFFHVNGDSRRRNPLTNLGLSYIKICWKEYENGERKGPFAKDLLWFKNDTKEEFLNDINNFWVVKDFICIRIEKKCKYYSNLSLWWFQNP
jgi:hypothetical protein